MTEFLIVGREGLRSPVRPSTIALTNCEGSMVSPLRINSIAVINALDDVVSRKYPSAPASSAASTSSAPAGDPTTRTLAKASRLRMTPTARSI
jgi:hypothetical protein